MQGTELPTMREARTPAKESLMTHASCDTNGMLGQEKRAASGPRRIFILMLLLVVVILFGQLIYEIEPWKEPTKLAQLLQRAGPFAPLFTSL